MVEFFLTVVYTCLLSKFPSLTFILIWAACYFTLINCRIPIYHAIAKIINRVLHEIFELSVPIQIIYFPGPQSNQPLKDADRLAWWRCCHPPPPPPFVSSVQLVLASRRHKKIGGGAWLVVQPELGEPRSRRGVRSPWPATTGRWIWAPSPSSESPPSRVRCCVRNQ